MNGEETKTTLPATVPDDGFDNDVDTGDRLIQGAIVRCVDGVWSTTDGSPLPTELIAVSTATALQHWQDGLPIETIKKEVGKPLPDVDELNSQIPKKKWETGLDNAPRPPWQRQEIVYLLDPKDASVFTYITATAGGGIAVRRLRDKVVLMRRLRGAAVMPVVKLDSRPMRTKFGQKQRPEFTVIDWRDLGSQTPAATPAIGKPVEPVTMKEELDDEVPSWLDAG